ncbi:MAG TPA: trypsin-like serine protease [Polyangia bacterium]|jgi:V8-like Glu-specific endopeptidase
MTVRMLSALGLAAAAAVVAAACAPGGAPPVSLARRPIINGSVDAAHPSVVALVFEGKQFCTGTVIAPRAILSAGHCLVEMGQTPGFLPTKTTIFFGTTVGDASGREIAVTAAHAHPQYAVRDDGAPLNDVSVWAMAEDAPAPAVAWQGTALGPITGHSLTLVGYGVTDAAQQTGNGTRRVVTDTVSDQDDTFLYYGNGASGMCQGDSGGPLFATQGGAETLVGVCSYGDVTCVALGAGTRVDAYAPFIRQYADAAGAPAACTVGSPDQAGGARGGVGWALALLLLAHARGRRRRAG